jgi:hypothetical protein
MLSYKEFYIWLEGYLYGKLENKHIDITPIVEKMNEVKDVNSFFPDPRTTIPSPFNPIIMPLKKDDDPYKPPYEVYCGDKTQLND